VVSELKKGSTFTFTLKAELVQKKNVSKKKFPKKKPVKQANKGDKNNRLKAMVSDIKSGKAMKE
jgi:hypothetical protein